MENVPVEARTCAEADLGHLLGPPQLETPLQIPAGRKHLCETHTSAKSQVVFFFVCLLFDLICFCFVCLVLFID